MLWVAAVKLLGLSIIVKRVSTQVQTVGVFPHTTFANLDVAPKSRYSLPPMDNSRILARELIAQHHGGVKPLKFGEAVPFPLNIKTDGEWTIHPSGTARVWRAVIQSPGASSLSVQFREFFLPPGAEFYVIGPNVTLGAFTGRLNNKPDGEFSTSPVPGDAIVLEYWEAIQDQIDLAAIKMESENVRLEVTGIVHGFRKSPLNLRDSGPCNIDVACPVGNKYRDLINSVGIFITDQGQRFCTGVLLNNPRQDGRQLFLTANHCIFQDTSRFIVGFNYQLKTCVSGGAPFSGESPMQTVQGMRLLVRWDKSDFALLEILENIPDSYNVYYAGWTRDRIAPFNVTGIHHPSGDVKKISSFMGQTQPGAWTELPNKFHWLIPHWSQGVTEPGSSGSPLFDHRGRVVGHLHGGQSSCEMPQGYDLYGALAYDWETGPSLHNRIKQFLDPDNKRIRGMSGNYYTSSKKGPAQQLPELRAFFGHKHQTTAPLIEYEDSVDEEEEGHLEELYDVIAVASDLANGTAMAHAQMAGG